MNKCNTERASCHLLEVMQPVSNAKWKVGKEWKWGEYFKQQGLDKHM